MRAPDAKVFEAIHAVSPDELPLFRVLMGVRALPFVLARRPTAWRQRGGSLLERFVAAGFVVLGEEADREIVLGLVEPTAGKTEIFGHDSSLVESREEVGFLPENPYFYKFLTGDETLQKCYKTCCEDPCRLSLRESMRAFVRANHNQSSLELVTAGMA